MSETVSVLRVAIEQRNWEAAALCLLAGVVEAARRYPPDAVEALIAELALELEDERPAHRRRRRRANR